MKPILVDVAGNRWVPDGDMYRLAGARNGNRWSRAHIETVFGPVKEER